MRLIMGSLAGLVLAGILAMMPTAASAHGGGGGGGHGFCGGVVTHLVDSPAVALVGDSARRGDFLLVGFRVAEITAALVTVVSLPGLFIGIPTILTLTPIWITDRITTINMRTIQQRLCNRNPSDPPPTTARLSSVSTQTTPCPWIQAPILRTSITATDRLTQQANKE